jgi:hypothetical protein
MSARIVIDPSTLRIGAAGPSTGEIWLAIDNVAFPAVGWNDFVVVILEAWIAAVLRIVRGSTTGQRVHFMDGPYEVELVGEQEGTVRIHAFAARGTERVRTEVRTIVLVADLLAAGDALASECKRIGDCSIDAKRLQAGLDELRVEAKTLVS